MPRNRVRAPALHQRVAAVIIDAAAHVFSTDGAQANMADVAAAAGVARATVYRYFPTRQALLDELGRVALDEANGRLTAARIEQVEPEEGVRRVVRALVEVGDAFTVVARERVRPDGEEFEHRLFEPIRRVLERGQEQGTIRADIPSSWLTDALLALTVAGAAARPTLGREDTIAAIARMFLDGARPRAPIALVPKQRS
jgi:TetR/AcrR family transcriptional repressor of mexCD-oprJ operon